MLAHEHGVYGLPRVGLTHGPADGLAAGPARLEDREVVLWDGGDIVVLQSADPPLARRGSEIIGVRGGAWTVLTPDLERLAATAGRYALQETLRDLLAGRYDAAIPRLPDGPERAVLLELAARVSVERLPLFGRAGAEYARRLEPALASPDVVGAFLAAGDQRAFLAPPDVYAGGGPGLPAPPAPRRGAPRAPPFLDVLARAAARPDFLPADHRAVLARAGVPGVHRLSDADAAAAYRHHAGGGRLPSRRPAAAAELAAAEPFAFRLLRHARDAGTVESRLPAVGEALLHAGR